MKENFHTVNEAKGLGFFDFLMFNNWFVRIYLDGAIRIRTFDNEGNLRWEKGAPSGIYFNEYWNDPERQKRLSETYYMYANNTGRNNRVQIIPNYGPPSIIFDLITGDVLGIADAR